VGKNFGVEVKTPLGNQSSLNHVVWHKNGGDTPRNVFSRAWQEVTKKYKNKKKTSEHDISPLCRGGPAGPIFTIFGMWGHTADVITHAKFQVNRSKGLGSTSTQNHVFPIDFDHRPYNSVTHYRATLWLRIKTNEADLSSDVFAIFIIFTCEL